MPGLHTDIAFLTDTFLGRLWPMATQVIRNQVLHDVWYDVKDLGPVRLDVDDSPLHLDPPPRFEESHRGGLTLALSGRPDRRWEFSGLIHLTGVNIPFVTNFRVDVTFGLALDIGHDGPESSPKVGVRVTTGKRGRLVARLVGAENWREDTEATLESRIQKELDFLLQASYQPPEQDPEPVLVHPITRPDTPSGLHLVLVADDFDGPAQRDDFDRIVAAVARELASPTAPGATEPLHSFKSALRLWRVDPPDDKRPVVETISDGSGYKVAFGNLGRLAAVGRAADELGDNIVVWLKHRKQFPADAIDADGRLHVRAMAMGNVVLMPTLPPTSVGDPDSNVHLLLHELGHTIIGHLGDEYDGTSGMTDADRGTYIDGLDPDERDYRGPDPVATNLAVRQPAVSGRHPFEAWRTWLDDAPELPEWDAHPVTSVEGAGYYPKDIWRPADECKMRDSRSPVPLCAVCREEITRRVRRLLGDDWLLLEVDYPDRDVEPERVVVRTDQDDEVPVHRVAAPEDGTEQIAVRVVAGTLPEPWTIRPTLHAAEELRGSVDHRAAIGQVTPMTTWRFPARFGDALDLEITSDCLFTPQDPLPRLAVTVRCDLPLRDDVPDRSPSTPTNLAVTGHDSAGGHVTLLATSEDPNGDELRVEFEVLPLAVDLQGGVTVRGDWLEWQSDGPVRARARHRLAPDGPYHFRARAVDRDGRQSPWSRAITFMVDRHGGGTGGGNGGTVGGGKVGGGVGGGGKVGEDGRVQPP